MITKENRFDAIEKNGEITLLLSARKMPPHNPQLGFNNDLALLSRDEHEEILLASFHKDVVKKLKSTENIKILEINKEGKVIFSYTATLFKDPELNLNNF
ncbi:MAG: hypothetical protein ACTSXL_01110 [Alphaproteobacteria bacterium]